MMNTPHLETVFTLTIGTHEMRVRYRPYNFGSRDPYAILEFSSPHEPRRGIPVSESGYRSFFAPMREIEDAPSIEAYIRIVALILARETSSASTPSQSRSVHHG